MKVSTGTSNAAAESRLSCKVLVEVDTPQTLSKLNAIIENLNRIENDVREAIRQIAMLEQE